MLRQKWLDTFLLPTEYNTYIAKVGAGDMAVCLAGQNTSFVLRQKWLDTFLLLTEYKTYIAGGDRPHGSVFSRRAVSFLVTPKMATRHSLECLARESIILCYAKNGQYSSYCRQITIPILQEMRVQYALPLVDIILQARNTKTLDNNVPFNMHL